MALSIYRPQAPDSGSYDGVDAMGFLWSMRPLGDGPHALRKSGVSPDLILLTAEREGHPLAGAELARLVASPGVTRTEVRDDGLYGTFFTPAR